MWAERGNMAAQFRLGERYATGRGVERDAGLAAQWIERAARQGHPEAQAALGLIYEIGRGVDQDRQVARVWYDAAAAHGDKRADKIIRAAATLRAMCRECAVHRADAPETNPDN